MHYHIKRSALIEAKSSAVDASRATSEVPFKPKAIERGRFNDKAAKTKTDYSEKCFLLLSGISLSVLHNLTH